MFYCSGFTSTSAYILSSIRHIHAGFIKHILQNSTLYVRLPLMRPSKFQNKQNIRKLT